MSDCGFPGRQAMRTNMPHIFAIGDIVGQPMLAHKAARGPCRGGDRGRQEQRVRGAPDPFGRLYRPEVAWAGVTEEQCKAQGIKYGKAVFPWAASAARSPTGATRVHQAAVRRGQSPCSAAASSAPMRAT